MQQRRIEADESTRPVGRVSDRLDAERQASRPSSAERDGVARVERQQRGRQLDAAGLARRPDLLEQAHGHVRRIGRIERRRGRHAGDVLAVADRLAGLACRRSHSRGKGSAKVSRTAPGRSVSARAGQRDSRDRCRPRSTNWSATSGVDPDVALGEEADLAAALAGVELERVHQPGQHVARRGQRGRRIAQHQRRGAHAAPRCRIGVDTDRGAELGDDPLERHLARAARSANGRARSWACRARPRSGRGSSG